MFNYSFNDDEVTNAENPLKPFDTLPKSATDLNSLDCDYNDNDDSFKVVFEAGTDDENDDEEENEIEDITDISDDGIIFKEETKNELPKPPPSRSISIVEMTQSKFWKDISVCTTINFTIFFEKVYKLKKFHDFFSSIFRTKRTRMK